MKKYNIILFIALCTGVSANVKLPLIFADGMVLQHNKPIPVWGWAAAGENIEVNFNKQRVKTKAGKDGKWLLHLKPELAGGPYVLSVTGKNSISLKDVLVGEVWICSGQSNMEFTVNKALNATEEMKQADFPMIRQFFVERDLSSVPKSDIKSGRWDSCNKETVGHFTAVGYYFAKKLYASLKIPVGLIHTSWGGTCAETWTSREGLQSSSEFKDLMADLPAVDLDSIAKSRLIYITNHIESIQGSKINTADEVTFNEAAYNDSQWPEMTAPSLWENQQIGNFDGTVWMRKSIVISKEDAKNAALLELAKIDDEDITYVNGIEVGTTNTYDKKRTYQIPAGTLREGVNTIAIRIIDYTGGGGIWGDSSDLKLNLQNSVISLAGPWKFNVVDIKTEESPNSYPSLLFNAMIHPLIPYTFQGVLWYQGEANVNRAEQYKIAFPLMINDWRTKWAQGNFPFYFVQLSSFNEFGGNSEVGSKWAELREAQAETLQVPNTGMAVTIDIGDAKDIHPVNKQDVGARLAAIALNNIYNYKGVCRGPVYKSMEIDGNNIILSFHNQGNGLMTTDPSGILKGFEIAGADKKFFEAEASIIGDKVRIHSDSVPDPAAVRYGWADDAGACNLYNLEKFPAEPFRTDSWALLTKDEKYTINK